MKIKLFVLIVFSFLCFGSISAQKSNKKITITGTAMGSDNRPIINAIIMIDDKKTSIVTDAEGKYKVKIKPDAVKIGIFTFGNGLREEVIGGRTEINFNFSSAGSQQLPDNANSAGEQGVGDGYGTVKSKNVLTQSSKIDGTKKEYDSYTSIADMIQRKTAGVKISGSSVIIQDSKDLFGSVPALIVVDGVYMESLPDIQPSSVKSIEILKGTAAAIYGSRGYGGVVVIKTKTQND